MKNVKDELRESMEALLKGLSEVNQLKEYDVQLDEKASYTEEDKRADQQRLDEISHLYPYHTKYAHDLVYSVFLGVSKDINKICSIFPLLPQSLMEFAKDMAISNLKRCIAHIECEYDSSVKYTQKEA